MAEVKVETILPLLDNVSDMSGKAFTVYNKTTGVAHGLSGQVLIDLDNEKVDKVAGSRLINTEEIDKLEDTSGTNTGDETKNSIEAKLGAAAADNDGFLKKEDFSAFVAKEDAANKSNNVIADGSSTTKFPTVKSIKDYADGLVVGLLDDRGSYDASSNQWPTTGGSGAGGAVLKGDLWYISVEGTLGSILAKVGYSIRALMDSPGQTASNWDMMNTGIGYVPENIAHKTTVINSSSTDTEYPTAKSTYTEFTKKVSNTGNETIAGIKTFSSSPILPDPTTNTQGANKKYVDDADALKIDKTSITSELGSDETKVVSQKLVSESTLENEEVTAQSLVELREEVRSLKVLFSDMLLTYAKITTLDVTTYRKDGAPMFIISDVVPAVVPDFVGQIYIKNTATVGAWIATGDSAISNWKQI